MDRRLPLWMLLALVPACGGSSAPTEPAPFPSARRASLDEGPFLPLAARDGLIVDAAGRQVILRGVQHHALQDVAYQGREVLPEDYLLIASWGFTTLRMAISWSRIEPGRGSYDDTYLDLVRAAMDLAQGAGLTVILEWHQDLWARCSQDPASRFAMNANGAPSWTCPASYVPSALGYLELFDRLWANADGLMDSFLAAWGHVIERLGDHPALVGYDVLNEPQSQTGSPAFERDLLLPAYRRLVPAMRARGARGLLFLESPGIRNETQEMYAEPLGALGPDLAYAPHLYSSWFWLFAVEQPVRREVKERDFRLAEEQARALGMPLWNGEWGVNLNTPSALADLDLHVGFEDAYRIGSSYWAFNRAVPGQGDDSISGGQSLLDEQRRPRQAVVDRLSRPYPIQTPGTLERLSYSLASRLLEIELTASGSASPLVLYAPRRHLSERPCLAVQGQGDWRWDERPERERILVRFQSPGRYRVVLAPCPRGEP